MLHAFTNFFASPEDKDPDFIRVTRTIMIIALLATLATFGLVLFLLPAVNPNMRIVAISVVAATILLESVALLMVLRGSLVMVKVVVPVAFILTITIFSLTKHTFHDISILAFPFTIILAAFLQGRRLLVITTTLTVIAVGILGFLDWFDLSQSPLRDSTTLIDITIGMIILGISAVVLNLLVERLKATLAKVEATEQAEIRTNQELRSLQASLEQRVEERTLEVTQRGKELELAYTHLQRRAEQFEALAQVGQTVSSVRELQKLLPEITSVISERFDFYHVGIFLIDEVSQYAILSAANSEGGRKMLERKHRLRVGEEGIVGYVTSRGEPRIAMDVGKDPVFFNNPDLPDTHSEMALPLRSEGRIIGALDVQSQATGAFQDEDVQMLSLLANQVSLAIENARLFQDTRMALSEAEAISRQFTREAWGRIAAEQNLIGYRYDITGATPLDQLVEVVESSRVKGQGKQTESAQVVVPIKLRGETIGNLVVQSPSAGRLTQDQLDLIKAVAERVALSAENARLFEETTRRAERERMVSDITGRIRSMNDPQTMIQTAVEELRKALGATRVEVIPQAVKGAE
jgi:GAF domain-containing protein